MEKDKEPPIIPIEELWPELKRAVESGEYGEDPNDSGDVNTKEENPDERSLE